MDSQIKEIVNECDQLLESLDTESMSQAVAQIFLKHCIQSTQKDLVGPVTPVINTVAEALTRGRQEKDIMRVAVNAVQTYLKVPTIELFGETLVQHNFLGQQDIDEMLTIQPKGLELGSFLVEQELISPQQRDIAVIAQKRLLSLNEVFQRLWEKEGHHSEHDQTIIENLKDIIQHFLVSTTELEDNLKKHSKEDMKQSLNRLENIIKETERTSHTVLEIVDHIFSAIDEIKLLSRRITGKRNGLVMEKIIAWIEKVENWNMDLNTSQGIQDRIGQQLNKIIPTIHGFHNQLHEVANKLRLNLNQIDEEQGSSKLIAEGYGGAKEEERLNDQNDVDNLLASLGL